MCWRYGASGFESSSLLATDERFVVRLLSAFRAFFGENVNCFRMVGFNCLARLFTRVDNDDASKIGIAILMFILLFNELCAVYGNVIAFLYGYE